MSGPGLAEHGLPSGDDLFGVTEVDLFGGQHRDAAMAVLGIIPTEERATEGLGLALIPEPPRKRGIMSDVDSFKDFNDTHGHVAGDEALKAVAKVLREGMRKIDHVARYGGQEFLVILPHTGIAGAVKVAERFRKQLAERSLTVGERSITLTVSTGVAEFPIDGDSPESLIVSADAALYQAKDGGRDRVARASRGRRTTAATSTKKPTAKTKKDDRGEEKANRDGEEDGRNEEKANRDGEEDGRNDEEANRDGEEDGRNEGKANRDGEEDDRNNEECQPAR